MKIDLFFVIGATNAGKSTLLEAAKKQYGDTLALVEVGKALRAKYPPSYFKGQQNPKHTAVEAWKLMVDGVDAAAAANSRAQIILVDGQPRDIQQTHDVINQYLFNNPLFRAGVLHLYAPIEVRQERAQKRDGDNAERLALSMARIHNDMAPLYDVMSLIHADAGYKLFTFDTSQKDYKTEEALELALRWLKASSR